MDQKETMTLGVILERREMDNPWQDHSWKAVAVAPGADEGEDWKEIRAGEGWVQYYAGSLPLTLFHRETEGYRHNLSTEPPRVFVVLRAPEDEEDEREMVPFLVTVCPYEAQDYLDSSEESVDGVPMPEEVATLVSQFISQFHVDEPFVKRRNRKQGDGPERGGKHAKKKTEGRFSG